MARISSLDRVFGLQNLLILHRLNGMLILNFGLTHAALIIFSTGWGNLPFRWQHWPALVGGIMLIVLLVLVGTSIFRQRYDIRDKLWLRFHKPLGYLAFTGIIVHLLNVSESYLDGLPRLTVYVIAGCVLAMVGSRKLARLWSIRRTGSITGLENVRSSAAVYICGPMPMMQRASEDCRALGFLEKKIFRERFQL
ncbi:MULTISPECIES: ferric reductase-like transmembrane domain-containing protein [Desulfosediminicola]|uniref:ferric reductase-like transmembrane domain-containing protein n=1 Tax=Desulfosediminicola TaxID=2886823 RepID=UPI0010AD71DC|nr:ferric reductase-like transmembrane domain-containing protein [Desulfosediminicola ganghwensis]